MQKGMRGVKSSPKLAQKAEALKTNQYYSETLVIKFNGLLSLQSLQQRRKKCLFPLTLHLY